MRRATQTTATVLGLFAGAASVEHGIFEVLQGNVRPDGLMIASMGPPCQPEAVWNACEPALTILPNFLITGILAILIGAIVLVWVLAFLRRKGGGLVLIGLSVLMLLFGGGIFPPVIGILAGAVGSRINAPVDKPRRPVGRFLATLWPWPLAILSFWLVAQWVVGAVFNDFMVKYGLVTPILILGLLALTVAVAPARDRQRWMRHGR